MRIIGRGILMVLVILTLTAGCSTDSTMEMGDKIVGVRSGRFIFMDRTLITEYNLPFDPVWAACEKTLAAMKASDIEKTRRIASGTLQAFIADDKVMIMVDYAAQNRTTVSILVGELGNSLASQLLHEKITQNLEKAVKRAP